MVTQPAAPNRPLKVGVLLPVFEEDMGGATARWSDLKAMAQQAEALGFDSVWVVDHLLSVRAEFAGEVRQGPWECWSILAGLAAATERIELGPLVTSTAFRNPALLAKMADTIDEMSGGRLILGLGAGWHEPEFRAFGFPFDHQVSRFAEALAIITGLLRHGELDFAGEYYQVRNCELRPRGPRRHGPPIMIGTNALGPRVARLIAQFADAWNVWTVWRENHPREIPALLARADAACAAIGREPATLGRSVAIQVELPSYPARADSTVNRLSGSPETLAAILAAYAAAGIGQVQVVLKPSTPRGLDEFGEVLALLGSAPADGAHSSSEDGAAATGARP